MRHVIMWNLVTVDGFFEGSKSMASGCVILRYHPDAE
jgi:hypothetical protein